MLQQYLVIARAGCDLLSMAHHPGMGSNFLQAVRLHPEIQDGLNLPASKHPSGNNGFHQASCMKNRLPAGPANGPGDGGQFPLIRFPAWSDRNSTKFQTPPEWQYPQHEARKVEEDVGF